MLEITEYKSNEPNSNANFISCGDPYIVGTLISIQLSLYIELKSYSLSLSKSSFCS